MTHLNPDALIDAMEGVLEPEQVAHLAACPECRRQLDDLIAVFTQTEQVDVPEPSPLLWHHLSARINDAIDADADTAWPQWLRWQVLLPLGATAMIILALMIAVPKDEPPATELAIGAATSLDEPAESDNWTAVATLVGEMDLETATAVGVVGPGLADRAVLTLTAEEQQELTRLLTMELTRAKS